jgi:predicted GTPase
MGYGPEQIHELEQTINRVDCDLVLVATPVDLRRLIRITHPTVRATYGFVQTAGPSLELLVGEAIRNVRKR